VAEAPDRGSPGWGSTGAKREGRALGEGRTLSEVRALGEVRALAALCLCFAALTALTWRKWGVPEIDAGAELTTADMVKHGALAYRDVRYYYGPLGLYSLALAFRLFGTSFTVAYAFGLAQAAAIVGAFYALARRWLEPLAAGLASAMVMAIGFSGTAFNFVLPHTNSATFGLLLLLLELLTLTHGRTLAAGGAAGLVGLTRPELAAVAWAALAAFALATWRTEGRATALRAARRLALPAVGIPAAVLGWFAWRVGLHTLVGENLWPAKFIAVGAKTEHSWMPFSAASFGGLALRAGVYVGVLWALLRSAEAWWPRRGLVESWWARHELAAAWPLPAAACLLALADGLLRASGVLGVQRAAIELEVRHLMLGMSALPALIFAVTALAALRLARRGPSPLGGSWPADAALLVVATALGLRAYNAFTTEGSYAPYYAPPLVLVLAIAHTRLAEHRPAAVRPAARAVLTGALGALAAGFAAYALGGLYVHENTAVHTPRGTFVTSAPAARALEGAVRAIDDSTPPGEPILAAPVDGGLYFMADRPPALRELTLLPGLLATPAEESAAITRLRREHVTLAVVAARDFSAWGAPTFGVNYAPRLGAYLHRTTRPALRIGALAQPAGGTTPSRGFAVLWLRA
jgi:hypothetical protein